MKRFSWILALSISMALTHSNLSEGSPSKTPLRYLALGDSYTIGEGVLEKDRWPVQLTALLRSSKLSVDDPIIIARSGWTTGDLLRALKEKNPAPPFDFVTLLIGTNNQFQGRSIAEYRAEFRNLLNQAIHLAHDKPKAVVVLSMPDWGATPFAAEYDRQKVAHEIDVFNAVNKEETAQAGAHYVEITDYSRRVSSDPAMSAGDGLHPSGKNYSEWARRAKAVLDDLHLR